MEIPLLTFLVFVTVVWGQVVVGYANIQGLIVHPDAQGNDNAGLTDIAMSSDGTTLAFSAKHFGNPGAYVYMRNGDLFEYQAGPIRSNEISTSAGFGTSLAMTGDGNTLVVSAPDDNSMTGAMVVFERNGPSWSQLGGKLLEQIPATGRTFSKGRISISNDGLYVAAGSTQSGGQITLFGRTGGGGYAVEETISLEGDVFPNGRVMETLLSADGSTLMVHTNIKTLVEHAFWVFKHNLETGTWETLATQVPVGALSLALTAMSAVSADGKTLAFALEGTVNFDGGRVAAVYVLGEEGSYKLQKTIIDPDFTAAAESNGIALSNNGDQLLVGVITYESGIGGTMVFQRTDGNWVKTIPRVLGSVDDEEDMIHSRQGTRLAISEDGQYFAASAPFIEISQTTGARDTGGVFVFKKDSTSRPTLQQSTPSPTSQSIGTTSFQHVQKVTLPNAKVSELFGRGVAISGDGKTAVVTAHKRFDAVNVTGGLFIYTRSEAESKWKLSAGPVFAQPSITTTLGGSQYGLAISGDGTIVAAEAPNEDGGSGAVGIIKFEGETWMPFGNAFRRKDVVQNFPVTRLSVGISADGSTLAVGEMSNAQGRVDILARTETGYVHTGTRLMGSIVYGGRQGGYGISLSTDGSTLAFSSLEESCIWAFKRIAGTHSYTEAWKLQASGIAFLGEHFAMSSDGSIIVATASSPFVGSNYVVLVFKHNTDRGWYDITQSIAFNAGPVLWYPAAVALSASGDELLLADGNKQRALDPEGGITRFVRDSDGIYQQIGGKFTGFPQIGKSSSLEGFGNAIAVSADGKRLIASHEGDDIGRGAAHFFDLRIGTASPSAAPSAVPSFSPSWAPSETPSKTPSVTPSTSPSTGPSLTPSRTPSSMPSTTPSLAPTPPTGAPSDAPSTVPSATPFLGPSITSGARGIEKPIFVTILFTSLVGMFVGSCTLF